MDLMKILGSVGGFMKNRANEPSTFGGAGIAGMAPMLMASNPYMMYFVMAMGVMQMLMKEKGKEE